VKSFPSRFRRLDGALADLLVEEPMLLTELDGFLTGLLTCPDAIPAEEWMTVVWGTEASGIPPFEDPLDVRWFANAVAARRDEIARDLARGKLQPILDVDERDGEVLWEYWIDGFAEAQALRPQAWDALANDPKTAAPHSLLATLIAVARSESGLDSVEVNALQDRAAAGLIEAVQALYATQPRIAATISAAASTITTLKVGRNDPCPCGSGEKSKRCCS
jgi:uncharacterized protein